MPKVIAVDLDDVANNFNRAFNAYSKSVHGARQSYDDLKTYDLSIDYDIDEEETHRRIFDFCHNWHDTIKPIMNAIGALRLLKQEYELQMVTSRCESIEEITHKWLDENAPNIFTVTHFTNGFATKHPERRRSKLDVCREIGAIMLIDDSLSHVGEVAEKMQIPVYMPNRPWNEHLTPPGVTRVKSFDEILEHMFT